MLRDPIEGTLCVPVVMISADLSFLTEQNDRFAALVFTPLAKWDDRSHVLVVLEETGRFLKSPSEGNDQELIRAKLGELEAEFFATVLKRTPEVSGSINDQERRELFDRCLTDFHKDPEQNWWSFETLVRSPLQLDELISAAIPGLLDQMRKLSPSDKHQRATSFALSCLDRYGTEVCEGGNFPLLIKEACISGPRISKRLKAYLGLTGPSGERKERMESAEPAVAEVRSERVIFFGQNYGKLVSLVQSRPDSRREVDAAIPIFLSLSADRSDEVRNSRVISLAVECLNKYGATACRTGNFPSLMQEALQSTRKPPKSLVHFFEVEDIDAEGTHKIATPEIRANKDSVSRRRSPAKLMEIGIDHPGVNARIQRSSEGYSAVALGVTEGAESERNLKRFLTEFCESSDVNLIRTIYVSTSSSVTPKRLSECLTTISLTGAILHRVLIDKGSAFLFVEGLGSKTPEKLKRFEAELARTLGARDARIIEMAAPRRYFVHNEDSIDPANVRDFLYKKLPPDLRINRVQLNEGKVKRTVSVSFGHPDEEVREIFEANRSIFDQIEGRVILESSVQLEDYTKILSSWVPAIHQYAIRTIQQDGRTILHISSVEPFNNVAGVGLSQFEVARNPLLNWLEHACGCTVRFGERSAFEQFSAGLGVVSQNSSGRIAKSADGNGLRIDDTPLKISAHALEKFLFNGGVPSYGGEPVTEALLEQVRSLIVERVASAEECAYVDFDYAGRQMYKHGASRYFYSHPGWLFILGVSARPKISTCYPVEPENFASKFRIL